MTKNGRNINGVAVAPGVRALIFDCDGTLVDTLSLHHRAWWAAIPATGQEVPVKFLLGVAGKPDEEVVMLLNKTFGYRLDPGLTAAAKETWFLHNLHHVRPIVPVVNLVESYRGRLPMAVASGSSRLAVQAMLAATGLSEYFETVVAAEDSVRPKPAPDPFLEAARRLNVAPEHCQVFEDSELGFEAARRAGMRVVDVRLLAGPQS
jgi:HAD superfamily hydrolase (TIGR01509 family)